jgi:hypothetical protein
MKGPIQKITEAKRAGSLAQVVEHLLSKLEVLRLKHE